MTDALDRRRFLKVLGVTGAGAAAVSCGIGPEPTERLIPYLVQPEDQIPGTATYYATTCRECAAGCGVRVRFARGGRSAEGIDSPINRGRLCSRGQGAIRALNPDRVSTRGAQCGAIQRSTGTAHQRLAQSRARQGIVFLTGAESRLR
jgi:molybdopterin-containing oxidoreductase family iron-sulfur binding subunit